MTLVDSKKNGSVRNIVLILMLLVALTIVVLGNKNRNDDTPSTVNDEVSENDENQNTIELCFADIKAGTGDRSALEDEYTLRMNIVGDTVTGEIRFLPAEKDSKTGTFYGVVGPVDPMAMARTADLWWQTHAEGMEATEETRVVFGEGTASIATGVMQDRGDGVYVYEDKSKLNYTFNLTDVDCRMLDERATVEEYLKKNIATLAPKPAVLGGTWSMLYSSINTQNKTGVAVYEDGHIQEKHSFSYQIGENGSITSLKVI